MKKSYKTISIPNLSKTIKINDKEVTIEFCGGTSFPDFKAGSYTTESKIIQDSIEKSNRYGKDYIEEAKKKQPSKPKRLQLIPDIISKQMALEWISKNLNKDCSSNQNTETIKNFLNDKGYIMNNWN